MPHGVIRALWPERQLGPSNWVSGVARRDTIDGPERSPEPEAIGCRPARRRVLSAMSAAGRRDIARRPHSHRAGCDQLDRDRSQSPFSLLSGAASSTFAFASTSIRFPTLDYTR